MDHSLSLTFPNSVLSFSYHLLSIIFLWNNFLKIYKIYYILAISQVNVRLLKLKGGSKMNSLHMNFIKFHYWEIDFTYVTWSIKIGSEAKILM